MGGGASLIKNMKWGGEKPKWVFKRGASPSFKFISSSPRVERGIKGVRLIKLWLSRGCPVAIIGL
jgi:hypothetical protein